MRIYFISLLALLFGCALGVQQSATTINPARAQLLGVGVNNLIIFTGGYSSLMDIYNLNTNTWSQSDLGCVATTTVSVGNYALFHCHNYTSVINEYTSTIHIFNSVSLTWSSKFFENGTYGPIAISCGEVALIGGGATANVWVFNSTDQSWNTITLTQRRYSAGACTNNYAVYSSDIWGSATTNVVNIITGQVIEDNNAYATYGQGVAKAGKFILIAGGAASPSYSNKVGIFNTETQTWSYAQLSSARYNMVSASVGDFAIFAGGIFDQHIDVFNANTMTWSTSALADAGYEFTSVVVGPYVMIGGGSTTSEYSSKLTVFNSTDQTWSVMYLSSPRYRIGTAATGNIAMWAGGFRDSWSPLINVVDIYDFTENIVISPPVTPVAAPVTAPVSGVSFVMPTDDATVRNGIYANNNYALEPTMYIKYSTNPDFTRQIYVKFPLQNLLPVGSSRAIVRLLGYYQSTLGPLNVQCYAVPNNNWNQGTITWNNKPALGALLSSTDIIHPISYYEWDVTSYVAGQQSSGATHVSFAFVRNTPGPDESTVLINSLEADVNRPMLAITN